MATVVDGLQDATAALNSATQAVLGLETQLTQQISAQGQKAQTVITNLINLTAINYLVDPVSGVDTNDGQSINTPMRTLEAALAAAQLNVQSPAGVIIFLLGDGVITRRRSLPFGVTVIGAQWGGGAYGALYHTVPRNLTVQGEAINSPVQGEGRVLAGIDLLAGFAQFASVNVLLPDVAPNTLQIPSFLNCARGASVDFDGGTVTAATSTTSACLFSAQAPSQFEFSGVLGPNAPGHVFQSVAAGQNPNIAFNYRTNLTSA